MHASTILRCCIGEALDGLHASRCRRLLGAVEALVAGRRLSLTELARQWPGADRVHAPLKALDRLLSNKHLHAESADLQRAMVARLLQGMRQPTLQVDWSSLKRDGRWALLRASVAMGGRAMPVHEQVFPIEHTNQPEAQQRFLQQLAELLPSDGRPILVTDAGFRSDWFRAVQAQGWDYVGRLRNNTHVSALEVDDWTPCGTLHAKATAQPTDLGRRRIVKGQPWICRMILFRGPRAGRDKLTRTGQPEQSHLSKKARSAAREPWLLVTSLSADTHCSERIVAAYRTRMQIEEAFRDLKSHRYGVGFTDSLTRKPERAGVLLLLNRLASFAAWLMTIAARSTRSVDPLARQKSHMKRYSAWRRGLEWLRIKRLPQDIRDGIEAALDALLERNLPVAML
jgi:hypothetical protein